MKSWALEIFLGLMILALTYSVGHLNGKHAAEVSLANAAGKMEQARKEAAERLERLTAERDEKQARLDRLAAEQEKKDADAKAEIERLAGELRDRPIRVRYVTAPSGAGSGGAASQAAGNPGTGPGDATASTGVLPDANSRRLGIALKEVETLSAAYNSCRSRLFTLNDGLYAMTLAGRS